MQNTITVIETHIDDQRDRAQKLSYSPAQRRSFSHAAHILESVLKTAKADQEKLSRNRTATDMDKVDYLELKKQFREVVQTMAILSVYAGEYALIMDDEEYAGMKCYESDAVQETINKAIELGERHGSQ